MNSAQKEALRQAIRSKARELEFREVAFIPAESLPTGRSYQEWLKEGRHGEMGYLGNHQPLRVDPAKMEPGTRSVVVMLNHYRQPLDMLEGGLRISRYAQGDDYHDRLWERMRELAAFIHSESGVEVATRPAVDTAPLLERDLARQAGLGWVGKNAMLIRQGLGSYVFIAEVLLGIDISESDVEEAPDRCGSCSRCIDACPTNAIVAPRVIDARRCIAYLTIELRGPIPRRLRPLIGDHLFGCDICQEVCPWNGSDEMSSDPVHRTREVYRRLSPIDLLSFDHRRYVEVFQKSAMKRAKLRGLKRNAAVVVGNCGQREDVEPLMEAFVDEEEPLVRGHIAWAIGRLGDAESRRWLAWFQSDEEESYVRDELSAAMAAIDERCGEKKVSYAMEAIGTTW